MINPLQHGFFDELQKLAAEFNGITFHHGLNDRDHYPVRLLHTALHSLKESAAAENNNAGYLRALVQGDPDSRSYLLPHQAKNLKYFIDTANDRQDRVAEAVGRPRPEDPLLRRVQTLEEFDLSADPNRLGFSAHVGGKPLRFVVVHPQYDRPTNSTHSPDDLTFKNVTNPNFKSPFTRYNRQSTRNTIAHEAFHANNPILGQSELLAHIYGGYKAPIPGSSIPTRLKSAGEEFNHWRRVHGRDMFDRFKARFGKSRGLKQR